MRRIFFEGMTMPTGDVSTHAQETRYFCIRYLMALNHLSKTTAKKKLLKQKYLAEFHHKQNHQEKMQEKRTLLARIHAAILTHDGGIYAVASY